MLKAFEFVLKTIPISLELISGYRIKIYKIFHNFKQLSITQGNNKSYYFPDLKRREYNNEKFIYY